MRTDPLHTLGFSPVTPQYKLSPTARAIGPVCEYLEIRRLLAAVPTPAFDAATGVLDIRGTRRHDTVLVSRTEAGVEVAMNGKVFSYTGVTAVNNELTIVAGS